jgi:hypothetical protein
MLRSRLFTAMEKVSLIRFFCALGAAKPSKLGEVTLEPWLDAKVKRPRVRRFADVLPFPTVYISTLDVVSADVSSTSCSARSTIPCTTSTMAGSPWSTAWRPPPERPESASR